MAYELHSVCDENIEFEYTSFPIIESNVILELYRGKLFCHIIKEFINKAIELFGVKIFSVKKSFPRTLTNLLSSWMFTLYASSTFNPTIDPFLPNNFKEVDSLKSTLTDLVKYDNTLENTDISIDILIKNLVSLFETQITILASYKTSQYYLDNKNKYKIYKKKKIQQRDTIMYDFYKFDININFEIKDKRLCNILDNLLIPIDEYEKLRLNYTHTKIPVDNLIWIVLFRYQLLGSNNHQLGVKSSIMASMKTDYNLNFECFASSINSTFKKYCSVYYDVEKYFGSVGSFYNIIPKRGTFGVNPPYQKNIINMALTNILGFLEEAEKSNNNLTFIITIPIWDIIGRKEFTNDLPQQNIDYGDFEIIKIIKESKYHKITRMIAKENFTYIDYNFKLLKNKTIQNTYVIILSTNNELNIDHVKTYDFN